MQLFRVLIKCTPTQKLIWLLANNTLFTTTYEKEVNADRIFTAEDGLQFAIGIVDYEGDNYEDKEGRKLEDYLHLFVA